MKAKQLISRVYKTIGGLAQSGSINDGEVLECIYIFIRDTLLNDVQPRQLIENISYLHNKILGNDLLLPVFNDINKNAKHYTNTLPGDCPTLPSKYCSSTVGRITQNLLLRGPFQYNTMITFDESKMYDYYNYVTIPGGIATYHNPFVQKITNGISTYAFDIEITSLSGQYMYKQYRSEAQNIIYDVVNIFLIIIDYEENKVSVFVLDSTTEAFTVNMKSFTPSAMTLIKNAIVRNRSLTLTGNKYGIKLRACILPQMMISEESDVDPRLTADLITIIALGGAQVLLQRHGSSTVTVDNLLSNEIAIFQGRERLKNADEPDTNSRMLSINASSYYDSSFYGYGYY